VLAEAVTGGLGWLMMSRAAFAVLTWYDKPQWNRRTCGVLSDWHTHRRECYADNLPASRRVRIAAALVAGPLVITAMAAWCWVYGLCSLAAWAVTAGQPRTRREIDAEEGDYSA
jgi:hypothetical protein